jgi:hypothetical protein
MVNLKKCFVISQIGEEGSDVREHADTVLNYLIKQALGQEFEVVRADDDANPGAITPRIVQSILGADLVVADITGLNPNVFYELAIAHGYRKPTVHIQDIGGRPPFDIKDIRTIPYDTSRPAKLEAAREALSRSARVAIERPEEIETPLKTAQQFEAAQASGDPVAQSNVQVLEGLDALRQEVRGLVEHVQRASFPFDDPRGLKRLVQEISRSNGTEGRSMVTADDYRDSAYVVNLERRAKELIREMNDPARLNVVSIGGQYAVQRELEEVREKLREVAPSSAYI